MQQFSKQPSETYTIALPFAGKLPAGANLQTGTVAAFDPAGTDVTGSVLSSGVVTIVGTDARIKVLAGVHGVNYKIRFRLTLDNSDLLEEDVLMKVENL